MLKVDSCKRAIAPIDQNAWRTDGRLSLLTVTVPGHVGYTSFGSCTECGGSVLCATVYGAEARGTLSLSFCCRKQAARITPTPGAPRLDHSVSLTATSYVDFDSLCNQAFTLIDLYGNDSRGAASMRNQPRVVGRDLLGRLITGTLGNKFGLRTRWPPGRVGLGGSGVFLRHSTVYAAPVIQRYFNSDTLS